VPKKAAILSAHRESDNHNGNEYACITNNDEPDTKSNPNLNPNPTTK